MTGTQHRIELIRVVSTGSPQTWSILVNPIHFRLRSRRIYAQILADIQTGAEITQINVEPILDPEILQKLVTWIDQGVPRRSSLSFNDILGFSTAVWLYECDPEPFTRLIESRQDDIRPHDRLGGEAAAWTFVALVFGLEESFRYTSSQLISEFDMTVDVVEDLRFDLPLELNNRIEAARLKLLRATFRFIRNTVCDYHLSCSLAFHRIASQLCLKGIDIRLRGVEYAPSLSHQCYGQSDIRPDLSPWELLDTFENILLDTPQEGSPVEHLPDRNSTGSSSQASSVRDAASDRDTGVSSIAEIDKGPVIVTRRGDLGVTHGSLRGYFSDVIRRRKTKRDIRGAGQCWNITDISQFTMIEGELREKIDSFKSNMFQGLDIHEFDELRRQRLLVS